MKTLTELFLLEAKRVLGRKALGLALLISLLALYFLQIGINDYKGIIDNRERFQDIERIKVEQYINYAQYGAYGFRIMFIPSPLSIFFFNSSTVTELTSNVDSGERLKIYNSLKGRTLFAEKSGGFKDFSGIMLLLGSLLVLFLGYESFIYKDYLRFMSGFIGRRQLFISVLLARGLLLILFLFFNSILALLLLKLNKVTLAHDDCIHLLIYLGILVAMLVFFLVLGSIAGSFRSRFVGFVMVFFCWFVFVFLIPGVVSALTSHGADNIASDYELELEKLRVLMDFEQRALERRRAVEEKNGQSETEMNKILLESYLDHEGKKIQELEQKMGRQMEENINYFQALSLIFPSTFYLSAGNEISSKGYQNFIQFFNYLQEFKELFVRFYIQKRFYSNFDKVESFIKGDENLYTAQNKLPRGMLLGFLLTLGYILGLGILSYSRFKKALRV